MATPGLVFRIGGTVDPSFAGSLKASTTMAVAENRKMMAVVAADIKAQQAKLALMAVPAAGFNNPVYSAAMVAEVAGRTKYIQQQQLKLQLLASTSATMMAGMSAKQIAAAQAEAKAVVAAAELEVISKKAAAAAMFDISVMENMKEFEAKKASAALQLEIDREKTEAIIGLQEWQLIETERIEAEKLAVVKASQIAMFTTMTPLRGVAGHGGGGIAGIIRESIVIMREISMGRGTGRIGGSITLLAQYLGLLGLAVHSTAAEALAAEKAAIKLSNALKVTALRAIGTAAAEETAAAATAQLAVATNATTEANVALATATVTLNPIFFLVVGAIVAAGATAFILWRHFERLAKQAKNLADALNPLKAKYTELAEAQDKAAKAAQEYVDWKEDLLALHQSESDAIERKIKLLHEEARARGMSETETLAAEKELLTVEKARLENQLKRALVASDAAAKAANAGATLTDDQGRTITLSEAEHQAKRLAEILDAAEDERDKEKVLFETDKHGNVHYLPNIRPRNDSDQLTFKVGGKEFSMTVGQARENFEKASNQARQLAADQKALDDVLKDAKSSAAQIQAARNKVSDDLTDIADEQKFPEKARRGGKSDILGLTDRQRAGTQVEGPAVALLDVNKRMEKHLASIDRKIDKKGHNPFGD